MRRKFYVLPKQIEQFIGEDGNLKEIFNFGIEEQSHKKIWINCSERLLNHEFNILGGWTRVLYGMKAKGFMGYKYADSTKIDFNKAFHNLPKSWTNHSQNILNTLFSINPHYKPINWQVDFKSGYCWPVSTMSQKIKFGHVPGVDVKIPWELSRGYHFVTMGITYQMTNEEKYAKEFICQILDWISMNPLRYGLGWIAPLNVAIRVVNWVVAWIFFREYLFKNQNKGFVKIFLEEFIYSLFEHGNFLMSHSHLDREGIHANHYLGDLSGLLILSVVTRNILKESEEWKRYAIEEMKKQIVRQIRKDGMDFESSTGYHRFVLEMLFYPALFAVKVHPEFDGLNHRKITKEIFGCEYEERLYAMFDFLLYALKPNGRMPWIGDNDSGRVLKFEVPGTEVADMRYLVSLGAAFFQEPWLNVNFEDDDGEKYYFPLLLLFNKKIQNKVIHGKKTKLKEIGSKEFPKSGIYISRSYTDHIIIPCGPIGGTGGLGGHDHNDRLSFELCLNGKDIIVDPGEYTYSASAECRNKFRSTSSHNSVMIDRVEQNRFSEKSPLWGIYNDTRCKCLKWIISDNKDIFEGKHYGYDKLKDPMIYKRRIEFNKEKKELTVTDILICDLPLSSIYRMRWNFILHPNCKIKRLKEDEVLVKNENVKIIFKSDRELKIEDTEYSPEYGLKIGTKLLCSEGENVLKHKFIMKSCDIIK